MTRVAAAEWEPQARRRRIRRPPIRLGRRSAMVTGWNRCSSSTWKPLCASRSARRPSCATVLGTQNTQGLGRCGGTAVRPSHGARIRPARHARRLRARATNAEHGTPSARWPVRHLGAFAVTGSASSHDTVYSTYSSWSSANTSSPPYSIGVSAVGVVEADSSSKAVDRAVTETEEEQRRADTEQREERRQQQGLRHRRGERFLEERGQLRRHASHLRPAVTPRPSCGIRSLIRHVMNAATPALPSTDPT